MPRSRTRPLPPSIARAVAEAEAKQRARNGGTNNPANKTTPVVTAPTRRDSLNATEARYLAHLRILQAAGEVEWIGEHESMAFRIADGKGRGKKAWYRPDFPVRVKGGALELHEVKGFWREAARVRIKVAATAFGWRFLAVRASRDGWNTEVFGYHV